MDIFIIISFLFFLHCNGKGCLLFADEPLPLHSLIHYCVHCLDLVCTAWQCHHLSTRYDIDWRAFYSIDCSAFIAL